MVGMATALCYLKLKNNQHVKEVVSNYLIQLNLLACVCFLGLVAISFTNEQVVLHSVVYMPLICIMLIITTLTRGGYLQISILQKFRTISFAFFLVHQMCIRYLHIIFNRIGCDEIYIVAPVAFILTIIASYFLTYRIDKNINTWLKKILINRQSMIVQ